MARWSHPAHSERNAIVTALSAVVVLSLVAAVVAMMLGLGAV